MRVTSEQLREITFRQTRDGGCGGGVGTLGGAGAGGPRSGRRGSERDLRRRCRQDDSGRMTTLAGWLRRCPPDTTVESRRRRSARGVASGNGSFGECGAADEESERLGDDVAVVVGDGSSGGW